MGLIGISTFEKHFKEFTEEKLPEAVRERTVMIAKEIFKKVIEYSPVDRGSFMLSNKIGIGEINTKVVNKSQLPPSEKLTTDPTGEKRKNILMPKTKSHMNNQLRKAKPFDTIYITNSVSHAGAVEGGTSKKAPVPCYGRAENDIRVKHGL